MHQETLRRLQGLSAVVGVSLLAACATPPAPAPAPAVPAPAAAPAPAPAAAPAAAAAAATPTAASEYYVVLPENGRYVAFGDAKTYKAFKQSGELAYVRTRIGAGPTGNTVVFGITSDDVRANRPGLAELIFDGRIEQGPSFYGEVFRGGRYFTFDSLKQMKDFIAFGEVPYSFTDIGAGPNGATVVWVMDANSIKQGRPTARIERFKQVHAN